MRGFKFTHSLLCNPDGCLCHEKCEYIADDKHDGPVVKHALHKCGQSIWQKTGCHGSLNFRVVKDIDCCEDNGGRGVKNRVATKFSTSTWGRVSGLSPIFLPRAKDQSVRGKAIPVNDITRKAVPQFLMSRGSVNVSLSTKIADVAIIREIQIATTEDIIIPK